MHPVLFKLGPLTIYTYGFFVFLGVITGYFVSARLAKSEDINQEQFSSIFFWTVIAGFLGAKILYLIIEWKYFLMAPLYLIRSGFVFYGGLISGFLTLFLLSRKYKLKLFKLLDIFSVGIVLGHAFGRVGCFFYGCCYGRPTKTFLGLLFPASSPAGSLGVKVIPTQLISAGFLFLLSLILLRFYRRKSYDGQVFIFYLFIYSTFRFFIEFLRGDPRGGLGLFSTSQLISLAGVIFCLYIWKRLRSSA
ncbi:MAG: prolipoprotein diacylglyceryl transferase [Candidatus Omnitrophica bacterium]|nr:prolipoprotein diacylglyceryl transferase [Candidatus Omnitrophota bacterium]MDD5430343.1 prolipoprotein diacylglyceryl transferase [Candidatus Omnitrophota bacterium]